MYISFSAWKRNQSQNPNFDGLDARRVLDECSHVS